MYKLTQIGPLPAGDHLIDVRLAWLIAQIQADAQLELVDRAAMRLSDDDLDQLASETFVFDSLDQAEAARKYAPLELSTEVWRRVDGYDRYQVSNLGRVRSLDAVVKHRGTGKMSVRGRVLKSGARPGDPNAGHPSVTLHQQDGGRTAYVSRLVLATFERPPEAKEIARFKNGDSNDVRLVNLRWGDRSEIRHATPSRPDPVRPAAPDNDLTQGSAGGVSWRHGRTLN